MMFGITFAGIWSAAKVAFNWILARNERAADRSVEIAREDTRRIEVAGEVSREAIRAGTERQAGKFNWPVFWMIVAPVIGAPTVLFWSVTIYNILWWRNGIWPQDWAIAEYPPSMKPWADMAMEWLFDPIGPSSTVGAGALLGWITRKGQ